MAPAKGNKPPLNRQVANNQMEDWFHPIFEPLADWTDRAQHPVAEQFRVGFQRVDGLTTPVPTSDDQRTKARLENLDNLIGLNKRWRDELKAEYIGALRNIQQFRRTKGRSMTEEELIVRLESWAEDAQSRIGVRPHAILGYFYNHVAAQRDPQLFLELWIENTGADPVTGE